MIMDDDEAIPYQIANLVSMSFAIIFYLTLLATLVLRLYFIFRGSSFEMTRSTKRLFVAIFIVLIALLILIIPARVLQFNGHGDVDKFGRMIFTASALLGLSVYVFGSALAVCFFARNLSKLAESMDVPQRESPAKAEDVSLDAKQQRLLDLSGKYMLLFLVVVLSTILSLSLLITVSTEMGGLFFPLDYCVNLFCLYLSFGFANEQYLRLCRCLDSRCKAVVSNRSKRSIHRESQHVQSESTVSSQSPTESKRDTVDWANTQKVTV